MYLGAILNILFFILGTVFGMATESKFHWLSWFINHF